MTLALLLSAVLAAQDDAAATRAAVERSLPFLEKEGVAWIQNRNCLSCHVVTFMLWSHEEARAKGIPVDVKKLAGWTDWSMKDSTESRILLWLNDPVFETLKREGVPPEVAARLAPFAAKPELKGGVKESTFQKELAKMLTAEELSQYRATVLKHAARGKGDGGGVDTMGQLLLAGVYGGEENREFAASTRAHIGGFQQPDGSWKPNGQLGGMNRAEGEAVAISTMWTAISLGALSEAAVKGAGLAQRAPRGKTTEWLVARTILEKTFGEPEATKGFARELQARQNPDGGWSAVAEAGSDGFATGQALYALSVVGSADDDVVRRARKFLVESQSENGSWPVSPAPWTKVGSKPDRLKRLEPIYRYWGTAWAAIGLARTLPAKS